MVEGLRRYKDILFRPSAMVPTGHVNRDAVFLNKPLCIKNHNMKYLYNGSAVSTTNRW